MLYQATSTNANYAPKTIIVDQAGTGDYRTFSEAIEELRGGSRLTLGKLLVHPGIYREQVILDLPIEIRGVGAPDDTILTTMAASTYTKMGEEPSRPATSTPINLPTSPSPPEAIPLYDRANCTPACKAGYTFTTTGAVYLNSAISSTTPSQASK